MVFFLSTYFFNKNNSENLKLLEAKTEGMNIFLTSNENIALNSMAEDLKRDIASLEKYCSEADNLKDLIMRDNAVSSDFLSDIFKMKPDNISISFLNINSDNISIQCSSEKIEEIMLFIERLRQIEIIDRIDLPKSEVNLDEGYSFFILCKCKKVNNNVHH